MTRTVYKYELDDEVTELGLDTEAKVVLVAQQHERTFPTIWIEHDPDASCCWHRFYVTGTGHPIPVNTTHVGSAICGEFVWHIYQGRRAMR